MVHIWSPVNGAVEIICEPLLPSEFTARLRLQNPPAAGRKIAGVPDGNGAVHFQVSAADVQIIKDNAQARLLLTTEHILIPDSADPRWGWRYIVLDPPGEPTAAGVELDGQGYFRAGPFNYPEAPAAPVATSARIIKF